MSTDPGLARELVDLALVVSDVLRQEFRSSSAAGTPTFAQFKMLHAIRRGVRGVGQLSERFGTSQPATSMMVDAMVKDGLLKRVPHETDRRRIELHLTARASARIDAIYARVFANIDRRVASIPAADRRDLAKRLRHAALLLSGAEE